METLHLRTAARRQWLDITPLVAGACARLGLRHGALLLQVPHTTAGVTVNEGYDPDVAADLLAALAALVPAVPFAHAEGNSDAHLLALLTGSSATIPVEDGALALGRWQRIFFCEYDGPRPRQLRVQGLAVPAAADGTSPAADR